MYRSTPLSEFSREVIGCTYSALASLRQPAATFAMIKEFGSSPHVVVRVNGALRDFRVLGEFEITQRPAEVAAFVCSKLRELLAS